MKDLAFIKTETLSEIGDSIRKKEYSEEKIPTEEMAERILQLPSPGLARAYFDTIDKISGKFIKPSNWDDIESIDISDKNECYLLCDCNANSEPFVSVRVSGGSNIYWSWGHVVDGIFIKSDNSTLTKISSGAYIRLFLGNLNEDYIVIKIEADNYLTNVSLSGWVADENIKYAAASNYNCVLMRYGRLIRGTNLVFNPLYLVSDRILDFGKYYWNSQTTITVSKAYTNCGRLQKCWLENFHPEKMKISSFESMFSACYALTDVKGIEDLSGWVTSECTSIASMFNACFSLRIKLIVKNWDVSNVTTMVSFCNNASNLIEIVGMETWSRAPKCGRIDTMFAYCYNLRGTLDFSSMYLGNGDVDLSCSCSNMFRQTYSIDTINLNNTNFSKVTSVGSMFQNSGCRNLIWSTNFTGCSSACTTVGSIFASTEGFKEITFDGWDFSGCSNSSNAMGNMFNYAYGTTKIIFKNCIAPTSSFNDTSSSAGSFYYSQNAEYIDFSFFDMSVCKSTYFHLYLVNNCTRLVHFFPPQHICKAFNISSSNVLSHESLLRIIDNLDTVTGSPKLSLGTINLAKLSDEEKSIAIGKGWTLA